MNTEKLRLLAPDLNRVAPRSPYAALDPFPVWAARLVDKCRAELLGQAGSYRFNCPMDREFLRAAGLAAPLGSHSSPPESQSSLFNCLHGSLREHPARTSLIQAVSGTNPQPSKN